MMWKSIAQHYSKQQPNEFWVYHQLLTVLLNDTDVMGLLKPEGCLHIHTYRSFEHDGVMYTTTIDNQKMQVQHDNSC